MHDFEQLIGHAINFGTGVDTTINRLADLLLRIAAQKLKRPHLTEELAPIHAPERPGEVRRFVADIGLAKKLLGFEPQISLKEGLEKYVDWYLKEYV